MLIDFHIFLESFTNALEARDYYTSGHSNRVAELSYKIAKQLGYDEPFCESVHIAGHLHDIGKIGIADGILFKATKLTDAEFEVMKSHPTIGYDILNNCNELHEISKMVKHHHERVDGTGYPDGLMQDSIPTGAKIIALADSFDAMVTKRNYKDRMTMEETLIEIKACSGSHFDQTIVNAFLEIIDTDYTFIDRIFFEMPQ